MAKKPAKKDKTTRSTVANKKSKHVVEEDPRGSAEGIEDKEETKKTKKKASSLWQ